MKVLYFAYRNWAFKILNNLLDKQNNKWKIEVLFTTFDPEDGYQKLIVPIVKLNPEKISTSSVIQKIQDYNPDILLFYGWSWLLPKEIYEQYLCLILHTSPLPKYRGGSPLQHQIMAGEKESAVTILKADKKIDHGPVYMQEKFSLAGTMDNIFDNIVKAGTIATFKVLGGLVDKKLTPRPQDERKATYYKRRQPTESELTLQDLRTKSASELYNFIRALGDPYPNAFIKCKGGEKLYLTEVKLNSQSHN